MSDCKFGQDEDKMIYFFLLSSLRKEHFEAVGIEEKSLIPTLQMKKDKHHCQPHEQAESDYSQGFSNC